ncbi:MAG TPA: hypothetical protein PKM56_11475, partial [Candidatus Rifleibacterium sp.]|nr:hypothetical protein [Candidatus Rifleibacterium sp.]
MSEMLAKVAAISKTKQRIEKGLMFSDPTFCDASCNFGGFASPNRYLIFSDNKTLLEPVTGLCVWKPGSRFMVIDVKRTRSHSQITLLELGDGKILHERAEILHEIENSLAETARHFFAVAGKIDPLREHQTLEWLQRISAPLGIKDDGNFFEIFNVDRNAIN